MMVVKITVGCRPSDGRVVPVVRGYLACIKKGSTLMRSWGKTRSFSIDLYKGLAQHCLLASFIKYNRCCNHVIFVLDGFSRSANAGFTLTRDRRRWPQAVAPTERGVEFPGGAEYRPTQVELSQEPHTRLQPVEAGVEEGLAGVFYFQLSQIL